MTWTSKDSLDLNGKVGSHRQAIYEDNNAGSVHTITWLYKRRLAALL
jgi:hypothetical protein